MTNGAARSDDSTPHRLPPVRLRVRVRGALRWGKHGLRRAFPRAVPRWSGPPAVTVRPAAADGATERVEIRVETAGQLRVALADDGFSAPACGVDIVVSDWRAPWPGWSGRLDPLPGLLRHEVALPAGGRGEASIGVTVAEPVPLARLVAAVLPVLAAWHELPATVAPDVALASTSQPGWLRSATVALGVQDNGVSDNVIRPYDVWLAQPPLSGDGRYGTTLTNTAYGLRTADAESIMVDALAANPHGRQEYGGTSAAGVLTAAVTSTGASWLISLPADPTAVLVVGRAGAPLDERQKAALHRLGSVVLGDTGAVPAAAQASVLAQLAMTGVVLHAPGLPAATADLLDGELCAVLRSPLPDGGADPLDWEARSVAQRRAALRAHAAGFALRGAAAVGFPTLLRPPSVSALLVTRRRQYVAGAVAEMAAQSYPELEIVVCLHGFELPAEEEAALRRHGRLVRVVSVPGEVSFGEALGEATRHASGSLVTKVDDDDRYGREHVWDLVLARHYSSAVLVGKGAEFVYLAPYDVTVRRHMGSELYTDVVAGGTMLLSRGDLEAVGGWRPVARSVDRGLLDRVLRAGGLVYRTHGLGFLYTRHSDGHTWDPGLDYFLQDPRRRWVGIPEYREFSGLDRRDSGQRGVA